MSNALFGVERDVILDAVISDKTPFMLRPLVKNNEKIVTMTLKYNEYRIYSRRILFFSQLLPQWISHYTLSAENPNNFTVNVTFFYRGRGLYFVAPLKRVNNGYVLIVPNTLFKIPNEEFNENDAVVAQIYQSGYSGVHSHCIEKKGFNIFENRLWLHFSPKESTDAENYLGEIAGLRRVNVPPYFQSIITRTKLLLYITGKKIPKRNFFPYPVTITDGMIAQTERAYIDEELKTATREVYIPFATAPDKNIHSIFALQKKAVPASPIGIFNTLLLLPICRFFVYADKDDAVVRGHSDALHILCITDSAIVLGRKIADHAPFSSLVQSGLHDFPLKKDCEYSMHLFIPLATMKRKITLTITVSDVLKNKKNTTCALCRFANIKEEDRRFLYERFNQSLCK
ncbi:MAG: hypothetical protein R3Y36_04170 [Spirochaetales bacterium]